MKVLLCSPCSNDGGISRWTKNILQCSSEHKHDSVNITQYYIAPNITTSSRFRFLKRFIKGIKSYYPFYKGVKTLLKNNHFDVVHICSSASLGLIRDFLILRYCKKTHTKSIVHFHFGRIPEILEQKSWECKLLYQVIKLADKVIVIDEKSYQSLVNLHYSHIELLPNPLSPLALEVINQNISLQKESRKIVFVGHVYITKGVIELVKACTDIPNIKLVIIGKYTDELKNKILSFVDNSSEQWLSLLGEQEYPVVIREMLTAGVFVLPTYTEGFPNVILESMACACPIVTTDVGAIPEMLDISHGQKYGICVKPKDVENLKKAIVKMINNREYALSCGQNARKRVLSKYSMEANWDLLKSIWYSLV